jgi:hypothetical protein
MMLVEVCITAYYVTTGCLLFSELEDVIVSWIILGGSTLNTLYIHSLDITRYFSSSITLSRFNLLQDLYRIIV